MTDNAEITIKITIPPRTWKAFELVGLALKEDPAITVTSLVNLGPLDMVLTDSLPEGHVITPEIIKRQLQPEEKIKIECIGASAPRTVAFVKLR